MNYSRPKDTRPKNLNLLTIRLPITALVSALHRISGFLLFLLAPILLWMLSYSLQENGFEDFQRWFSHFYIKLLFWAIFIPYCYHLVAGIRHLLTDIHIGDSLKGGRLGALLTIIISLLLILLVGIWLW